MAATTKRPQPNISTIATRWADLHAETATDNSPQACASAAAAPAKAAPAGTSDAPKEAEAEPEPDAPSGPTGGLNSAVVDVPGDVEVDTALGAADEATAGTSKATDNSAATAAFLALQASTTNLLTITEEDLSKLNAMESVSDAEQAVARLVCQLTGSNAKSVADMKAWLGQEDFAQKLFKLDIHALPQGSAAALEAAEGSDALKPKVAGSQSGAIEKLSAWLAALLAHNQAAKDSPLAQGVTLDVAESQSCSIM